MTDRPNLRLHHGCISVADMDRSIEFYSRVLGFEQESRQYVSGITAEIAFLRRAADRLEIICHDNAKPLPEFVTSVLSDFQVIGTKHLSFSTDNAEQLHAYLSGHAVDDLTDIFDNNPTYKYFFFRDPDGIAIEVVSEISGNEYQHKVQHAYP